MRPVAREPLRAFARGGCVIDRAGSRSGQRKVGLRTSSCLVIRQSDRCGSELRPWPPQGFYVPRGGNRPAGIGEIPQSALAGGVNFKLTPPDTQVVARAPLSVVGGPVVTVSSGRHRRFDEEPFGAAEYFGAPPRATDPDTGAWDPTPGAARGPEAGQIADYPTAAGSPANPVPDWPPDSLGASWPQWGGPPPAMHPDHPSAPVPRVRVPQAPAQAGPTAPGQAAPGIPSGPPAGPPHLPRRRPMGPSPSSTPNAGSWFSGAGGRARGQGPANPARNMPRAQQDFNTGDIYNSGQFPPVPADPPARASRPARPNRPGPGPANRPPRPGGPGWANAPAGPPAGPAAPNAFVRPGRTPGPNRAPRPNGPAQGFGPPRGRNADPGYPPAQDYSTGQGFGPPPGQGHRPANSGGRGPGAARASSSAPRQGYNAGQGRARAPQAPSSPAPPRGIDPGQGYPQPTGPQSARRLYAVSDSSASGVAGMGAAGPAGGRMAQFGGGQAAVALADPAWRGGPQDSEPFRGGQTQSMPGAQAPAVNQAWSQATAIREQAEKDAAAIRQEALAIREAAEREAAEMRAAILSMSEQLSRMSAYVTGHFPAGGAAAALAAAAPHALAAAPPATLPTHPAPRPAAPGTRPRPAAPGTRPGGPAIRAARPVAKPGQPATRPGTSQGRQVRAGRKMFALLAILVTAGTITGTAQVVLHGGRFFLFRENGAGASETGLTDSQFPGHPGAPAPPKHAK
jgi:hypothetical protein